MIAARDSAHPPKFLLRVDGEMQANVRRPHGGLRTVTATNQLLYHAVAHRIERGCGRGPVDWTNEWKTWTLEFVATTDRHTVTMANWTDTSEDTTVLLRGGLGRLCDQDHRGCHW